MHFFTTRRLAILGGVMAGTVVTGLTLVNHHQAPAQIVQRSSVAVAGDPLPSPTDAPTAAPTAVATPAPPTAPPTIAPVPTPAPPVGVTLIEREGVGTSQFGGIRISTTDISISWTACPGTTLMVWNNAGWQKEIAVPATGSGTWAVPAGDYAVDVRTSSGCHWHLIVGRTGNAVAAPTASPPTPLP